MIDNFYFIFQEAIDLCVEAIEKAGYTGKIKIGMDVAASEFCKEGNKYDLDFKNADSKSEDWVSTDQLCEMYHGFIKDAPVVSIEDGFDQVIKKYSRIVFKENLYGKRFVVY